jgi:putative transposase
MDSDGDVGGRGYVQWVLVRYRYRAYPTLVQAQLLARTFGCARVVFNDALRARADAYAAGETISDTQVQRQVVTLAKSTPARQWLGEVASVALVQACQDARRAYRNWFDSLSGRRRGRRVGHPRFRSRKDNRQSIRLTRNGFGVTTGGVRLAKVGDVRLVWSRVLPSVPSSVTVIREADGRYYASFVLEVADTPLPQITTDVGIDLGLSSLAVLSTGEVVANPRHLRRKARALARAQKSLARKTKGSKRRAKAVRRVAVQHRKVRETRLDGHHKLAQRIVRDNQAIYVEDLAVSGLARTRLAKSVHDAGWSMLVRLLQEKAARCHRSVVKVGRWFPSSQLCSTCGFGSGKKPLDVRSWTCTQCGLTHDRDVNAARNILVEGRKVAAGLAETVNARGGGLRPGLVLAVACETRTHQGAA